MANALKGWTYINYASKVREGAEQHYNALIGSWEYRGRDIIEVQTSHVVPNGKWVIERPRSDKWQLVGKDLDSIKGLHYTDRYGVHHTLYVGDSPFGWVVVDEGGYQPTTVRRRLCYARQIHKGELGFGVPIQRLPYVRQAFEDDQKPSVTKARERRRGYGWIRLADVARVTGLTYEDVVFGYWNYSGHRNYQYYGTHQSGGVLLDIVNAVSGLEIEGRIPTVHSMTWDQMTERLSCYSDCWPSADDIWIRRGFAYTVLRLLALGVQPATQQIFA